MINLFKIKLKNGQNNTLKEYPAELSLTALICLMGTVEGGIVAVIMERRRSAWEIGFDARLLAAVYTVSSLLLFFLPFFFSEYTVEGKRFNNWMVVIYFLYV